MDDRWLISAPPDHDWQALRDGFLGKVQARSGSMKSRLEYEYHLLRFSARHPDPLKVTVADVSAYAYGPGARGRSPSASTVVVRLSVLSSWYEWLIRFDVATVNPCHRVDRPRVPRKPARALDEAELDAVLRQIPDTPAGLGHRAAILGSIYTGLRSSALLALRSTDLRFRHGAWVYRAREKGGQVVEGEMPPPAMEALARAAVARGAPLERLRPADRLYPMSGNRYWFVVTRYVERAGLPHACVHALRHSAAALQRKGGAELEEVSAFLHHSSVAITAHYLRSLVPRRAGRWKEVQALLGAGGLRAKAG